MLTTKNLVAAIKLERQDLSKVLLVLSNSGWTPALIESQKTFLKLAGVEERISVIDAKLFKPAPRGISNGDVFFKEQDLYYIINNPPGKYVTDPYGRVLGYADEENKPQIEIGILSLVSGDLNERLLVFACVVEEAIKSTLDNLISSHTSITLDNLISSHKSIIWKEEEPDISQFDRIISTEQEQTGLHFNKAKLIPEELQAAQVLADKLTRENLIELVQAGFVRERDILNRKKGQEEIRDALIKLKNIGLLDSKYLLECRQGGKALTFLKSKEQLGINDIGNLTCPSCHAKFSNEILTEGYSPSDFGRYMSRQSYWMTVWVTEQLTRADVPTEAILWNIAESGEEVDLLVGFLGQLWIFELKDREFGSGDAYPLNYRQVRYRTNKTIIVTTDKVSKDAKRVFQELLRGSSGTKRGPIYIEGLENAESILRKELSDAALLYAQRRLASIQELAGYDLAAILAERFGESS